MKNLIAINDGLTIEFKYRGICKYGGLAAEYLHEKVLSVDIIHPKCQTGRIIYDKVPDVIPSIKKYIVVSARYEELGLKHLGDYEKIPQQKYTTIVERALGATINFRGKKYIVAYCPDDFGPCFALSYKKLSQRLPTEDRNETGYATEIIVAERKNNSKEYDDINFTIEDRGDSLNPRLRFCTNTNQPWPPTTDFVFCLIPM